MAVGVHGGEVRCHGCGWEGHRLACRTFGEKLFPFRRVGFIFQELNCEIFRISFDLKWFFIAGAGIMLEMVENRHRCFHWHNSVLQ